MTPQLRAALLMSVVFVLEEVHADLYQRMPSAEHKEEMRHVAEALRAVREARDEAAATEGGES